MPDIYAYTGDAFMRVDDEATWSAARNAASAETVNDTTARAGAAIKASANSGGTAYDCYRFFIAFDTSGITVKPESATLKLHSYLYVNAEIVVVKVNAGATGDSSTNYIASDFSEVSSTAYSAEVTSLTGGAYNEITLNDDALNDMLSLDEFKIAIIDHDFDFNNTTPPNNTTRRSGFYAASNAGTSEDPYISYVAGTPAGLTYSQSEAADLIGDDYTINSFKSGSLSNQYDRDPEQVPFSLGVRGPRHLRGRTTSYTVTLGGKEKK